MPEIVINRNGRRTVIAGWRAWLIVGPAALLAAMFVVLIVGLVLGIALTVATFLLFAIPLAFVLALIVQALRTRR
jgi:hypothetical protein